MLSGSVLGTGTAVKTMGARSGAYWMVSAATKPLNEGGPAGSPATSPGPFPVVGGELVVRDTPLASLELSANGTPLRVPQSLKVWLSEALTPMVSLDTAKCVSA